MYWRLAVGWCELAHRAELPWLARARHQQPPDDLPAWSIPCSFVRGTHRHHGVMEALIQAPAGAAAAAGAPALEAYPVDTAVPGHTRNLSRGRSTRHGFQVVARHKPERPVMRRDLGGPA